MIRETVGDVEEIEFVLTGREELLAMGSRTAHEDRSSGSGDVRDRPKEGIADGERQRTPDGCERLDGRNDEWIERDDSVEVRRVDRTELIQPAIKVRVRGVSWPGERFSDEPDRCRGHVGKEPGWYELGAEADDNVWLGTFEGRSEPPRIGSCAEVDERWHEPGHVVLEGAGLEVRGLADERDPETAVHE